MDTKKKISLMLVVVLLMQIMLPMLTIMFESELTLFSRAEEGQNTWDISATNQDHVTATFDEETGILTISGTGDMKNWTSSSDVPWTKVTEKIKNVTIEEGVTTIGSFAFYSCRNLRNITIPESVTEIRSWVFKYCTNLTSIDVKEKNNNYCSENGILFNKEKTKIICYPEGKQESSYSIPWEVTSIGDYAFSGCTSLEQIEIPEGVTSIGYRAFSGCTSLTSINVDENNTKYKSIDGVLFNKNESKLIQFPLGKQKSNYEVPATVTSIENSAFYCCKNLTSIKIPEGVTSIEDYSFYKCSSLEQIEIPEGVKSIGISAFYGCTSLKQIEIPEGVTSIEDYSFHKCSSLEQIEIPESVTSIGWYAFSHCTSLEQIKIPEGVTNIGKSAFWGCTIITSIEIPEGVTSIGISAFYGCTSLKQIEIPEGVTNIGHHAFYGCTSLEKIEIPEGVTSIGVSAFEYCQNLTKIKISNKISSIGQNAFRNTKLSYIEIPQGKTAGNIDMGIYKENEKDLNENIKVATGMNIKISDILCKVVVKGDLNGDGQVGDIDLLRLARYKVGLDTNLTGEYLQAADLNGNKNLADDIDLLMMARALVGLYNL